MLCKYIFCTNRMMKSHGKLHNQSGKRTTGERKKPHGVASSGPCGGPVAKAGAAVGLLGSRLVLICHSILPLPNHPSAPLNSAAELQHWGGSANSIYPSFVNLLPSPEPCGCSVLLGTELGLFGLQRGDRAELGCCTEAWRCHPKNNLWSHTRLPGFELCPAAWARQLNTSETY